MEKNRWLPYVLPLAVYMIVGTLEPSPQESGGKMLGLAIPYSAFTWIYTAKILLTLLAMGLALPGYRQFRRPPGLLALLIGAAGIVVWVSLWMLSAEVRLTELLEKLPGYGHRSEYDPVSQLDGPFAWTFLAIRFFGLVLVVPVIEEFFCAGSSCAWSWSRIGGKCRSGRSTQRR